MISLPPLGSVLLPIALLLSQPRPALSEYTSANTSALHDNSEGCSCYRVNTGASSKTPAYFQHYRFFDFRNLAAEPAQYVTPPRQVSDSQDQGEEPLTHELFKSDAWTTDWGIQYWSKPATDEFPIRMVHSPANIYIGQNNDTNDPFTWLTLRTSRLEEFQSTAEVENMQKNLMYGSLRMRARVQRTPGAVAGFFTFQDDVNESDIEILTSDPEDTIRYTNQPALDDDNEEVPEASQAVGGLSAWDEWQTHRIDWIEGESYWYINGKQVAKSTYSVPSMPSYLVMNMWSDGGSWSGEMAVGESAEMQVIWVEMVFNTSGPVGGPMEEYGGDGIRKREEEGCKTVCRVDDVETVGRPEGAASGQEVPWVLVVMVAALGVLFGV